MQYSIPTARDLVEMRSAITWIMEHSRTLRELVHDHYDALSDESLEIAQFVDAVDRLESAADELETDLEMAHGEAERLAEEEADDALSWEDQGFATVELTCPCCTRTFDVPYKADTTPPDEETFVCQDCMESSNP